MNGVASKSDLYNLIKKNWVILSGGTSGSYLFTVPDKEQIMDNSFSKILQYFYDVVLNVDENARFVLVIDRRKCRWSGIRPFLNFVQENFPNKSRIDKIFLLQPSGFFLQLIKLISMTDDTKIEFITSTLDLHKKLDKSLLSKEFDGLVDFKMDEWLRDKEMVDEMEMSISGAEQNLNVLMENIQRWMTFDQICSRKSSEVDDQMRKFAEELLHLHDVIVECQSNVMANQKYYLDSLPSHYVHKLFLDRLEPKVEEVKAKCHEYHKRYETFIENISKSLSLLEQLDQITNKAQSRSEEINSINANDCKTLDEVHLVIDSLKNLENDVESLKQEGRNLLPLSENLRSMDVSSLVSDNPVNGADDFSTSITTMGSSVDEDNPTFLDVSVLVRLKERLGDQTSKLDGLIQVMEDKIRHDLQSLDKICDAISMMDKALEWNKMAEELLCQQLPLLERAKTSNECLSALMKLKQFLETFASIDLKDISSFQSSFNGFLNELAMDNAQNIHSELSSKQTEINKMIESFTLKESDLRERERMESSRACHHGSSEISPLQDLEDTKSIDSLEFPQSEDPEFHMLKKEASSLPVTKSRRFPQAKIIVDSKIIPGMMMNDKNICQRLDIINASRNHLSQAGDIESTFGNQHFHLIDIKQSCSMDDMEKYIPMRFREDLIGIHPVPDSGTIRRKRSHVIQELIETERTYTSDLKNIIEGYYDQFENMELQDLIPKELIDKRNILFGNIKDIYSFHSMIFLKSLESCESRTYDVGKCFVENKERFQLYSTYCQNKIQAEILIAKVGDNNPFFRECQRRLNHPLPFSSYILKPVQRITKYHLLLKELVRMTTNESETADLKKAIMAISDVLRYVNNSMHQLSITGFPGNLAGQGKLLIQGSLEVSMEKRKDRGSSMKLTFHRRQVFLYDRSMLFCKRKDAPTGMCLYVFKSMLKTDEVGPLVETPKGGDERRFELWSKNEIWSFITPTPEEKLDWIEEIKKVLFEQMNNLRTNNKRLRSDLISQRSVNPAMMSAEPDSLISSDLDNCSEE